MCRATLEGPLLSAIPEPPRDRFRDLVMKGGIASGVVYPKAIGLLARHCRFKSIGGTSAGAIAAVVTAAAEYQRRVRDGARDGFVLLEQLPSELQSQLPGTHKSKLLSLFQPQPGARRLFSVLIRSLNSQGTYRRILRIVGGFVLAYWPATLGSVALAVAAGLLGAGGFGATLLLMLALPVSIGLWVYFDLTRRIVDNGFGMCTGMTEDATHEALTPWLHGLIQAASGRPGGASLTFGGVLNALSPNCAHATEIDTLLADAMQSVDEQGQPVLPAGYEEPLTAAQREALCNVIQALGRMAQTLSDPGNANAFKPIPKPELRVRPPL